MDLDYIDNGILIQAYCFNIDLNSFVKPIPLSKQNKLDLIMRN